jgi:hypothetical protein
VILVPCGFRAEKIGLGQSSSSFHLSGTSVLTFIIWKRKNPEFKPDKARHSLLESEFAALPQSSGKPIRAKKTNQHTTLQYLIPQFWDRLRKDGGVLSSFTFGIQLLSPPRSRLPCTAK